MPWKTIYNPLPGKRGAKGFGTITAIYTDGSYSFSISEKVEKDNQSEMDKFKKMIVEAMVKHREEWEANQQVQIDLDIFLNN